MRKLFLGVDTSNYTTSIAVLDDRDSIVFDLRKMLNVSEKSRGLRQSDAFFQHSKNLPEMAQILSKELDFREIRAIGVSYAPRRNEKSYMPVFLAGLNFSKVIGSTIKVPVYEFSHQEGHIRSARFDLISGKNHSRKFETDSFITFHLSGGTTEILKVEKTKNFSNEKIPYKCKIVGGSLDISFGQLLDRIGVSLGYDFPAGKFIDDMALKYISQNMPKNDFEKLKKYLKINIGSKKVYKNSNFINLSGFETKIQRMVADIKCNPIYINDVSIQEYIDGYISFVVIKEVSDTLKKIIKNLQNEYKNENILLTGGVSESKFIQNDVLNSFDNVFFGKNSKDNAIGVALLGEELWKLNQ